MAKSIRPPSYPEWMNTVDMTDHVTTTTNVYLIVTGWYSNLTTHCAFTTLDLALEYAAHQNDVPIEVQRRYHELRKASYIDPDVRRETADLDRQHRHLDSGHRVEICDIHDSLPIIKP